MVSDQLVETVATTGGDSGTRSKHLLPCIEVRLEGGIKVTAWLDTLSSACVLNPEIIKLSPYTVVKQAGGYIGGANKECPSAVIGVIDKLLIGVGSETVAAQRVILSKDTPVGFVLGYDFIKRYINTTHVQDMTLVMERTGELVSFVEAELPMGVATLAMNVVEQTSWVIAEPLSLLPGRSATPVITPVGAAPTDAMVFTRSALPLPRQRGDSDLRSEPKRQRLDPNLQLDVVVELVWQSMDNGKYRVLVVNRSGQLCQVDEGTTIMVSDPVA